MRDNSIRKENLQNMNVKTWADFCDYVCYSNRITTCIRLIEPANYPNAVEISFYNDGEVICSSHKGSIFLLRNASIEEMFNLYCAKEREINERERRKNGAGKMRDMRE